MPLLIETPEQQLQYQLGLLMWENTGLRAEVERLRRELAEKNAPDIDDPSQPDLA